VSDEPLFRPATYGDESYEADPRTSGVTVGATFAHDADMTWHAALLLQMRTGEVKYGQFRRARAGLPGALVRRVLNGMSQALIAIVDDRTHRRAAQAMIENRIGKRLVELDRKRTAELERMIDQSAGYQVLSESPLARVTMVLGDVDLAKLARSQVKRRNIGVLAVRAVAAFQELLAPIDERAKSSRTSLFVNEHPDVAVLREAGKVVRVFDEGNQKATKAIQDLRAAFSLRHADEFDEQPSGLTLDASSRESRHVGAGDLAAGYAHALYMSEDGVHQVAEAFRRVVLNGEVVRV
jgi:hypothetical protein